MGLSGAAHPFLEESDKASVFEALKGPQRRSHQMGNGEPWMPVEQSRKGITLLRKQSVALVMTRANVCEALTECWRWSQVLYRC